MGVLKEYHQALGDLIFRFEGTLRAVHRRRDDGVLQRPGALRRRGRCARSGWRWRCALRMGLAEAWAQRGHDLGLGIGIAQGYATLGKIGFEGRLDYAAIGNVTNCRHAVRRRRPGRSSSPSRSSPRRRGRWWWVRTSATARSRFSRGVHAFSVRGSTARGPSRDRRPVEPPDGGPDLLSAMSRRAVPTVRRPCAHASRVWNSMRLNHDDESVVVVPSITLDRAATRAAACRRHTRSGSLPAVLLRQPRLRMVYVTSMPIAPRSSSTTWPCFPGSSRATRGPALLIAVNDASRRSLSEKARAAGCCAGSRPSCPTRRAPTWCRTTRRTWSATSR